MQIPFTVDQFFGAFRAYNTAVWPAQVVLLLLAVGAVALIALRRPGSGAAVSAILAVLWIWLGAAYHLAFFTQINPVAYGFGTLSIVGGLLFAWHGVVHRRLQFNFAKRFRTGIGSTLIVFALLVYPLWATLAGHGYPALPTFGLPCPTTIFTIGVLALASGLGLRAVLTVPLLWALVGSQAAFFLDVKPDLGLLVAGLVAVGLFIWPARGPARRVVWGLFGLMLAGAFTGAALLINRQFATDMQRARAQAAQGSVLLQTRCGAIEYQEAGAGVPLLAVHGSGGGHDQGMAFASALAQQGIRVIAMSRFGYLRTPMPARAADASAAAQADAHVCLLDALGIARAAVMGGSAGGPSALQMAIRHPDRVSALVLLVPLAYKPATQAESAPPMPAWVENTLMRLVGSDWLFWVALHVARDQVIKLVLATPPELLATASAPERARLDAMLTHILPVSARAEGLKIDSAVGKHLTPSALGSVRAPTLVISARDDRYGTYASAQYTASQIAGAQFIGFDTGGHTWVGHNDEVMAAIAALLLSLAPPTPLTRP